MELVFTLLPWGLWKTPSRVYQNIPRITMCIHDFKKVFGPTDTTTIHLRISQVPKGDDAEYVPITIELHKLPNGSDAFGGFQVGHGKRTRYSPQLQALTLKGKHNTIAFYMAQFLGQWLGTGIHEIHVACWEFV